jgi:ABC-type Na+ efflux pump permease subunit
MYQILTIALRDLYTTFTNRNLILIMIATPLLLSTIIGLAFGGGGTQQLNLAIVNLDEGIVQQGNDLNLGKQIVGVFQNIGGDTNTDNPTLAPSPCPIASDNDTTNTSQAGTFALDVDVTLLENPDEARQAVNQGDYIGVIIIPETFSDSMTVQPTFDLSNTSQDNAQTELEFYANSSNIISAEIIKSILEGVTNRMTAGNIVIQSTIETLMANPIRLMALGTADADTFDIFSCAFDGTLTSITLDQKPLNSVQEAGIFVQIVVAIGSAQAAFFALFTATQSILSIYEEKKQGTFDRLAVAPIPRWYLLAGKLAGTFITVIFQVVILMIGLITVASIVQGDLTLIWGTYIFHLIIVILSLSLSVSGIGVLVAGLAKDAQQAQVFSPIINILLAFFGGAFGIQMPDGLRQFSLIFWGSDAFNKLSTGNTDIFINVIILTVLGAITFTVGTWLFSRRIEI